MRKKNINKKLRNEYERIKALQNKGSWQASENQLLRLINGAGGASEPAIWARLALARLSMDKHKEAVLATKQGLSLDPQHAWLWQLQGVALRKMKQLPPAHESLKRAVLYENTNANYLESLGNVCNDMGLWAQADQCFERAISLAPNRPTFHSARAQSLRHLGRYDEALEHCQKAQEIDPDYSGHIIERGMIKLIKGEYQAGFEDYEGRIKSENYKTPRPDIPLWDGKASLSGKSILLYTEQGLGDHIQFCRFVRPLLARGASVTMQAPASIHWLLSSFDDGLELLADIPKDRPFDFSCFFMSLPFLTGVSNEDDLRPDKEAYLSVSGQRVEEWRQQLDTSSDFKIAIVWQGKKTSKSDSGRSFPLKQYEAIAKLPGVRLISLQINDGREQLANLPAGMFVEQLGEDFDTGPHAFSDTAAVMKVVDLVITSDTAIAHLAGALGVPTWVVLRHVPDWRWQLEREDCPFYPTMRLFRQPEPGNWQGALESVFEALKKEMPKTKLKSVTPHVPVSWGEVLDKITILRIKEKKISDPAKLANVQNELRALEQVCDRQLLNSAELDEAIERLQDINEQLWQIEDDIRLKEKQAHFGPEFIALARDVYQTNDKRAAIKKDINKLTGSGLVEEKSYA